MTPAETQALLIAQVFTYSLLGGTALLAKQPRPAWYIPVLLGAAILPDERAWTVALTVAAFGLALWQGRRFRFVRDRSAEWIVVSVLALLLMLLWVVVGQSLSVRDALLPGQIAPGRLAVVHLTITVFTVGTFYSGRIIGDVLEREGIQPPKPSHDDGHQQGLEHGWLIGYLERILAIILVAYGSVEGIGFLVAAKGLVRAQEWKNRALAEYFLVGTLLSILMATGLGLLLKAAYAHLW